MTTKPAALWSLSSDLKGEHPSLPKGIGGQRLNCAIAQVISEILKTDGRSREVIADEFSDFAGERVSKSMLDAYASPARETHTVPVHRFLALIAFTGRWDALDAILHRFSVRVATPPDLRLLELGILVSEKSKYDRLIDDRLG